MAESTDCTRSKSDCKEIIDRVIHSLDGSLTAEEQRELMDEIGKHPCCLRKLNIQRSYKVFLCQKIQKKPVPDALVDRIRTSLDKVSSISPAD